MKRLRGPSKSFHRKAGPRKAGPRKAGPANPFSVVDLRGLHSVGPRRQRAQYRLYFEGGAQPEQNSLKDKGARGPAIRKNLVCSWIIQANSSGFELS